MVIDADWFSTTIETFDSEAGDLGAAKMGPLLSIDYDPVSKGNDIVITTGVDAVNGSHTIKAPVEVWLAQHDNGELESLEIVDQNNVKTGLGFGATD